MNDRPGPIVAPVVPCKALKSNPHAEFATWLLRITTIDENVKELINSDFLQRCGLRLRCFNLKDPVEHERVRVGILCIEPDDSNLLTKFLVAVSAGQMTENIPNFTTCDFCRSTIFMVNFYYFNAIFEGN